MVKTGCLYFYALTNIRLQARSQVESEPDPAVSARVQCMRFYVALLLTQFAFSTSWADDHAVALIYHHVNEDTPALTSVSPVVFEQHLDYLAEHQFNIWPLSRILDALDKGRDLPANTVAITFDDAYRSIYTEAFPRLRKRNWPFTIFVSSSGIDNGYADYLNWDQLREMAKAGNEISNHSHSHAHLVRRLKGESNTRWQTRVRSDIEMAAERIKDEIGSDSSLFAYPYGEYSQSLKAIVRSLGYHGIAQQSGAIGAHSDLLAIPRFPMATGYADLERFAIVVNSRPLPVTAVAATGADEKSWRPIKRLQVTLADGNYSAHQLGCYRASGTPLETTIISEQPLVISVTVSGEQTAGRHKINCAVPASNAPGVFYWYSHQWMVQQADGTWYRE
jgi:biofilm PGA synthesis lipoprotein PgaB